MSQIEVVAVTHRGRARDHNEDTVAVAGFQSGAAEGQPVRFTVSAVRPVTCLVADGLGGHAEGGRASRLAASVIADAAPLFHDASTVVKAVQAAGDAVYEEMAHNRKWSGMGAAIVVLVVVDDRIVCVNVGDCRCFLLRDRHLVQLSTDDSLSPEAGQTTIATVVTQTLGGRAEREDVQPHVLEAELRPGDQFLLCSDGLTDELPAERIETELVGAADPMTAVTQLLRAALDAGGRDNVSILLTTMPGGDR